MAKRMKLMAGALMTATLFAACTYQAGAEEPDTKQALKLAYNNLSHEYTICASFYALTTVCMEKQERDTELVGQLTRTTAKALDYANLYARRAGLASGVVDARYKLANEEALQSIERRCSNISIILARYTSQCRSLLENPTKALDLGHQKALRQRN